MHNKLFFLALLPLYPSNTGLNSQRHNSGSLHLWKKGKYRVFEEMEQTEAKRGIYFAAHSLVSQALKGLQPFHAKPDTSHKQPDPPLSSPLPFLIQVIAGFLSRKCMNPHDKTVCAVLMDFDSWLVFFSQAWPVWDTHSREQMWQPRKQRPW